MHILLIHQYYQEKEDPGGLRWNAMTKLWADAGHQVTVIAGMTHYTSGIKNPKYRNKYTHTEQFDHNIKVIRTHVSDAYNKSFQGRMRAYFSFVWSGLYGGLFKARDKYDLILVSSPPLSVGIVALVLSFFKRIPFIIEVRDLWPESAIDTGIIKNRLVINLAYRLESLLYKRSLAINVVTPAMKEVLTHRKNISAKKVIYIPNAADLDISEAALLDPEVNRIRQNLGLANKLSLCYVGAHGVANHLEQIIEAAELLRNEQVTFILVGDGMQKQHLVKLASDKGLDNVIFIDQVSKYQALKFIAACDIGLSVLKKADTFKTVYSNKTFDYLACKKPVIMAIDGVSRQLIEVAKAGIYVEPESAIAIAEAVRKYKTQPELIATQGENGYQYVRTHFDRRVLAYQYLTELITRCNKPTHV